MSDSNPHTVALIPELPSQHGGGRLGRHIHFDARSRAHPVPSGGTVHTKLWERKIPPFDQGTLGSCTGNGAAGLLATTPFHRPQEVVNEKLARDIYSRATHDDTILGLWPPDDTGSTVLAAMKALQDLKFAKNYVWCFGLDDVLRTLSNVGPVEVGVNWYDGFDEPDAHALVKISGRVRGGHAFELLGVDAEKKLVTAENSWGTSWGASGRFHFSWDDLARLLKENGEAATIVPA